MLALFIHGPRGEREKFCLPGGGFWGLVLDLTYFASERLVKSLIWCFIITWMTWLWRVSKSRLLASLRSHRLTPGILDGTPEDIEKKLLSSCGWKKSVPVVFFKARFQAWSLIHFCYWSHEARKIKGRYYTSSLCVPHNVFMLKHLKQTFLC